MSARDVVLIILLLAGLAVLVVASFWRGPTRP
jgi:hypothetical protein